MCLLAQLGDRKGNRVCGLSKGRLVPNSEKREPLGRQETWQSKCVQCPPSLVACLCIKHHVFSQTFPSYSSSYGLHKKHKKLNHAFPNQKLLHHLFGPTHSTPFKSNLPILTCSSRYYNVHVCAPQPCHVFIKTVF